MNEVLIFGGTTEGRLLAGGLSQNNVPSVYFVATGYGADLLGDLPLVEIREGRLSSDGIKNVVEERKPKAIVDATHPYATEVKKSIREALIDRPEIPLFCVKRSELAICGDEEVRYFDNENDCAASLLQTDGTVFLTTGTKTLPVFSKDEPLRKRLFVRVIPNIESLKICEDCGIAGDRIIAAQGPFSKEENLLMLKRAGAKVLVMKESGREGGEDERIEAARDMKIPCFLIKRPVSDPGDEIDTVFEEVLSLFDKNPMKKRIKVSLIGTGTKYTDLTLEALSAIENASMIFGAKRVLSFLPKSLMEGKECFSHYRASDILPVLNGFEKEQGSCFHEKSAVVLFSGDSGFFSGAAQLYNALLDSNNYEVNLIPGISSVSAFSSKLFEPWSDAAIVSSHGKKEEEWVPALLDAALHNERTYLLTSGNDDVKKVHDLLDEAKEVWNGPFEIIEGKALGTDDECIGKYPAGSGGPVILFIKNNSPKKRTLSPFLSDSIFTRGSVPMTKEDVRALSVSKLSLFDGAVLYDIGCGTGSISCAAASLSPKVRVYSIDNNDEAIALTKENAKKLFLPNIEVIKGEAPECLSTLPLPDCVFIGGSKGRLSDILEYLFSLGKKINVVINAVKTETLSFLRNIIYEKKDAIKNAALDEISVKSVKEPEKDKEASFLPNNPIYILSFEIRPVQKYV